MSDEVAIKVENVSKTFRLPHEKNDSIKGAVLNFYKRKKTYEKQQAVKDISFEIKKGEFFGIVGRNGGGKSTLLKMLAGIYSPSKGGIQVNGKLTPFIELGVGFNPELTGRENVFLNGALLGFNRKEMSAIYEDIVSFAELERFMDQKLKNYSSGMQVRLAFSIAIRAKGDILLLDEVLAVGDAAFQQKCYNYFSTLKEQKRTVILVSHDMDTMMRYCTRAILIDKGKLIKEGNPSDVANVYLDQIAFSAAGPNQTKPNMARIIKSIDLTSGSEIKRGELLSLKITAASSGAKEDLNIGVSILHHGQYVAGVTTKGRLKVLLDKSDSELRLTLDTAGLAKGAYNIGYSVRKSGQEEFIQEGADGPTFSILDEKQTPNIGGVAHVKETWELIKSR